jgi:hypothetical protein
VAACNAELGVICTIAGSGSNGYAGDDGPALEARLSLPQDTLTAPDGGIYILDWNNHRVRKVGSDGIIRHVAGRGELGGTLDDPALSDFNHPTGLAFGVGQQSLIVAAWHNSLIREIDLASGVITTTCGDGRRAYFGDDGPANVASLDLPASVVLDPEQNLVIMDQANQVIRRVDSQGEIHLLAGQCVVDRAPPEGPGPCIDGGALVACPGVGAGKRTCGDPAASCSQPCSPGYAGDGGRIDELRMAQPVGQSADPAGRMLYDAEGTLYFADTANQVIRSIDARGNVARLAGTAPVNGVAQFGYSGDGGSALDARLYNPVDLALGDDGTLYFTDVYNHCVRAVARDGSIDTVAGVCGQPGFSGDGGAATSAQLKRPYGLEWSAGTLVISDTGNNVIRRVVLSPPGAR